MRFLCLGFLRETFGSIGLAAGMRPMRSRAMAFTSVAKLKLFFFFRGKNPPKGGRQHFRREGFVQESDAPRSGSL